jgi:hypothetical protein
MALISQKFTATITDDRDPTTIQEVNFTDDAYSNYSVTSITLSPFNSSSHNDWKTVSTTTLFDASAFTQAGYIIVKTDTPIYVWFGKEPERDGSGAIDEVTSPKTVISRCLILSGGLTKLYAINPSKNTDTPPVTAHIKVTIVY